MNMNNENLLKRFIKRKITFTTSLMVGFLITGGVVFAADDLSKYYEKYYLDGQTTTLTEMNAVTQNQEKISALFVANPNTKVVVNAEGNIVIKNEVNSLQSNETMSALQVLKGGNVELNGK